MWKENSNCKRGLLKKNLMIKFWATWLIEYTYTCLKSQTVAGSLCKIKIGNIKRINTKSSFFLPRNEKHLMQDYFEKSCLRSTSPNPFKFYTFECGDLQKQQRFGNFKTFSKVLHRSHHMDFLFQNRSMYVI